MQDHIDRAIDTYKNGEVYDQTSDEFTKDEDGLELYLSLQHFNFSITQNFYFVNTCLYKVL